MEAIVIVLLVVLIGVVGLLAWERLRAPRVDTRADVAQTMVSIHTESPGYFVEGLKGSGIEVIVPEYAERIEIR